MGHICVVTRATHDMRPADRMFDMPDIEYVFFVQNVFLHLEIVYHISTCKKTFWMKKSIPFFCERRAFIQFKLQRLQFWPLNDQITVTFVWAAGVHAKGRMRPAGRRFDMPGPGNL
jgi:hypothetical protein